MGDFIKKPTEDFPVIIEPDGTHHIYTPTGVVTFSPEEIASTDEALLLYSMVD